MGMREPYEREKSVVSTPEKLDFALRNDPAIIDDVGLIVLDKGHMLGPNEREGTLTKLLSNAFYVGRMQNLAGLSAYQLYFHLQRR